jgi:hypothetical protein
MLVIKNNNDFDRFVLTNEVVDFININNKKRCHNNPWKYNSSRSGDIHALSQSTTMAFEHRSLFFITSPFFLSLF